MNGDHRPRVGVRPLELYGPRIWSSIAGTWSFAVALYVVLYVAFLPRVALEGHGSSDWESLADNKWFVAASYIVAFLPWAVYGVIDHVDSQWRKIEDLRWKTGVAALLCHISILQLLTYSVVQFLAEDWKEAFAALVVLVAAWLPLSRVSRQGWLLKSSRDLGNVLHTLPSVGGYSFRDDFRRANDNDRERDSWSPGNSNKFFDNDDPGEGVTGVSSIAGYLQRIIGSSSQAFLQWSTWMGKPLSAGFFVRTTEHVDRFYRKLHYYLAMHVVTSRLMIVAAGDQPNQYERSDLLKGFDNGQQRRVLGVLRGYLPYMRLISWLMYFPRSRPAKAAENGLTRSLWLYENLTGEGRMSERRGKLAQVLHLGLVVHVGVMAVQGLIPENLDWINVLAGPIQQNAHQVREVHHPSYGHLKTLGVLLHDWFPKGELRWFQNDDFDEVFAKLPTERCSLKRKGHLRWENIMFIACSTIELHAFVQALFWGHRFANNDEEIHAPTAVDTIWMYIAGAFVANHCVHGDSTSMKKLHEAVEELPAQYKTELQDALIWGPDAVANWNAIIVHCGNMVDVVTDALRREPPPGRQQTLMPENLRGEDWRIQLPGIRDALVGTLRRLLPSHRQLFDGSRNAGVSATASGSASEAASAQCHSATSSEVESTDRPGA